jgi:hypothetical protein
MGQASPVMSGPIVAAVNAMANWSQLVFDRRRRDLDKH